MSLDFDRSPDGEPRTPAGQTPVPTHPAPATTEQEDLVAPSFTPKHAAGEPADDELADDELGGDELGGDEPTTVEPATADATPAESATDVPDTGETGDEPGAYEPGSAAYEPTAPRPVVPGSVVDETEPAELADDEPVTSESAPDDEPAAAEPVLAEPAAADEATAGDEAVTSEAVPADATASEATAYGSSAAPAWDTQAADDAPSAGHEARVEPAADLDGPLLADTGELNASWQRIQVAFIDDPQEAVADAAELVDHMGQVLVSALRQRQQQLRAMWDRDGMTDGVDYADSGSPAGTVSSEGDRPAAGGPDTEQLRLLIRRYRALFNELCRP